MEFSPERMKGWCITMNIAGVTQTAQVLPTTQLPQAESYAPVTNVEQTAQMGADAVNFSAQVQTQVMDLAQQQFEQAANELISQMAAATGVGTNVDIAV